MSKFQIHSFAFRKLGELITIGPYHTFSSCSTFDLCVICFNEYQQQQQ